MGHSRRRRNIRAGSLVPLQTRRCQDESGPSENETGNWSPSTVSLMATNAFRSAARQSRSQLSASPIPRGHDASHPGSYDGRSRLRRLRFQRDLARGRRHGAALQVGTSWFLQRAEGREWLSATMSIFDATPQMHLRPELLASGGLGQGSG